MIALSAVLITLSAHLGLASTPTSLFNLNPYMSQPYMIRGFKKYFNYAGGLEVKGVVGISMSGDGQKLEWALMGIETACATSGPTTSPNSCGLHYHVGTDCSSNALGHYWNNSFTTSDPWKTTKYSSQFGANTIATGLSGSGILGHSLIVHDRASARVACGIIAQGNNMFTKYFNYSGSLTVTGTATLASGASTGTQLLEWSLQGIDPTCTQPSNASNSCGIRVHAGTSCTEDAAGHYYNSGADPWTSIVYTAGTPASGSASVNTQLQLTQMVGHTLIIYDKAGARIACGIVGTKDKQGAVTTDGAFSHHLDLGALVLVWVTWALQ